MDRDRRKRNEKIVSMERAREGRREKRALKQSKRGAAPPKRRNRFFVYRKFYAAALLALLIMAGFYAFRIIALKTDEAQAIAEFEAALDRKARLENELEHIDDPAYIEQQARTRLRMIKPGEIYYVLPERESDAENGTVPE
jgi:cell division protein FtsB